MNDFEDLDALLNEWAPKTEQNPQLKDHVWRRIASDNQRNPKPSFFNNLFLQLDLVFRKPLMASAFLFTCVLTGLLIGELRIKSIKHEQLATIAKNYIQMIDPQETEQYEGNKK